MRTATVVPPSSARPQPRPCDGCLDAVLLLHHHPIRSQSPDVIESVRAFTRHSRFPVLAVNTRRGFPPGLARLRFRAVLMHYTLFYAAFEPLSPQFLEYLTACPESFKVVFFQDEQAYTRDRFEFCERFAVDAVYTQLAPAQFDAVYGRYTRVPRIVSHYPGYVSDRLVQTAARLAKPPEERGIDVGYRGRLLPAHWGAAAREKYDIAVEFRRRAAGCGLALDIETDESKRIYGRRWYEFIADCRGMLGTESGASSFDLAGAVPAIAQGFPAGAADALPASGDEEIPYRTISPRHLEAAAFRVCQVLFEGRYAGLLEPMVHYIPLRKDFANFDEVLARFRDAGLRAELTDNAYRDLIASRALSYERFVAEVDEDLAAAGLGGIGSAELARVKRELYPAWPSRSARTAELALRDATFPDRPALDKALQIGRRGVRWARRARGGNEG
jgi:hypothetical protein